jgi:hypothetical protein
MPKVKHYKHAIKQVKDLIPYVNNSRTHDEDQVRQIASSINEFGFTNPESVAVINATKLHLFFGDTA